MSDVNSVSLKSGVSFVGGKEELIFGAHLGEGHL